MATVAPLSYLAGMFIFVLVFRWPLRRVMFGERTINDFQVWVHAAALMILAFIWPLSLAGLFLIKYTKANRPA
jgi:hypothetical protein